MRNRNSEEKITKRNRHIRSVWRRLSKRSIIRTLPFVAGFVVFLILSTILFLFQPPRDFPVAQRVEIPHGHSLIESARLLDETNVVRSSLLLQMILLMQFAGTDVKAGVYYFNESLGVQEVAEAITKGLHGIPPVRVTVHEGLRIDQIATLAATQVEGIIEEEFLNEAEGKEGFLFPETYFIPETFTAKELVELMEETYEDNVDPLRDRIEESPLTEEEVITFASILEREGSTLESKRTIAGILYERMRIGMPLQVDAAFEYFLNKPGTELTFSDLEVESPYNTYLNTGLPPTPIASPGLDSIEAVLDPIASDYLYYLTAPDGTFHYTQTFEQHRQNKFRYLR